MPPARDAARGRCSTSSCRLTVIGASLLLTLVGCADGNAPGPSPSASTFAEHRDTLSHPVFLADQPPDDFSDATLEIGGGTVDVHFQGRPGASRQQILQWIGKAGEAVTHYFGRFPVKHVTIQVRGGTGRVRNGATFGGRRIRIMVGQSTKQADLDDDWIMTHEMFHLGFPDVPDRYNWMEEGLSTYLEPIARVRVGDLTPERIWKDMVEGMPRGLPRDGDRGLDNTPTHGRI
jgi:hypothetical protein